MIVGVKYKNHKTGEYSGRAYSYLCDLDNPEPGDLVVVPVKDGECEAMIAEVDIDPRTITGIQLKWVVKYVEAEEKPVDKPEENAADCGVNVRLDDLVLPEAAHQKIPSIEDAIILKQLPIIEDRIMELRGTVEKRVQQACSLVCTESTYKEIKRVRAELNKEFNALEKQRKAVKNAILEPYMRFEGIYKGCVATPYQQADKQLAERIRSVTDGLLAEKANAVLEYFVEYRASKGLDFPEFQRVNIKITMSDSLKKLKDQAKEIIDHVAADVEAIRSMDYADEILVEYKKDFMLNAAVYQVVERHKAIEAEQAAEVIRREQAALQEQAAENVRMEAEEQQEVILQGPAVKPNKEHDGYEESEAATYTTAFRVIGTLDQLKALKQFLVEGGYIYEQL